MAGGKGERLELLANRQAGCAASGLEKDGTADGNSGRYPLPGHVIGLRGLPPRLHDLRKHCREHAEPHGRDVCVRSGCLLHPVYAWQHARRAPETQPHSRLRYRQSPAVLSPTTGYLYVFA